MRSKVKAKWKIRKLSRYCKDVGKTIGVNLPFYQDLNGIYCENTRVGGEGGDTEDSMDRTVRLAYQSVHE